MSLEVEMLINIFYYLFVYLCFVFFFFFQAEDGIRDRTVTGVQTCALPISRSLPLTSRPSMSLAWPRLHSVKRRQLHPALDVTGLLPPSTIASSMRSKSTGEDRKSTRLNSSHRTISYAVFFLKKKKKKNNNK